MVFLPGGSLPKQGEIFRQPELARTLETSRSTAPAFSIAARLLPALCSFTKQTVEHWVQKT
jgi:hypothetical protein